MKKSVILSILGLSVAALTSYGQGNIAFNTYLAQSSAGILTTYATTGNGGVAGDGIDNSFTGWLLWSTTNPGDSATAGLPLSPLNGILNLPGTGNAVGGVGTFDSGSAQVAGYIAGTDINISAAVGTSLFFELVAFNGPSYGAQGFWSGHSASFAATLVTGTTLTSANQINNMAPFQVYYVPSVPEPATMALGGLGLASLLLFRRKQA